jgi:DNA-binding NarL/FixJ family response regulator
MIGVLLVDDEELVRAGLKAILDAERDIEVLGEASDGAEVPGLVRRFEPDVVLMDVRMPAVRHLLSSTGEAAPRVLVLTTFGNDGSVYDALRAGATGFLLKSMPRDQLTASVRAAVRGDRLLAPALLRRLLDDVVSRATPAAVVPGIEELTPREEEVLRLMARGLSNAELADRLVLGEGTVKTHVARVLAKLGVRDRVQAVIAAYESGLVKPGEDSGGGATLPRA